MAKTTEISWCDSTFNPWIGCTKVAPGCLNCYAEADMDKRRGRVKWGPQGTRSRTSDAYWKQPLKWNREAACICNPFLGTSNMEAFTNCPQHAGPNCRPRVFCASLADVFEDWQGPILDAKGKVLASLFQDGKGFYAEQASEHEPMVNMADLRRDLFTLIDKTPNLDWLLLTKRPENIQRMWPDMAVPSGTNLKVTGERGALKVVTFRPNVWLLTSVSDQATADAQIPNLLACRDLVPVLGLSCEPLLGPIQFPLPCHGSVFWTGIKWLIAGGESGPRARPCNFQWIRDLVKQCRNAKVPCFVKQLGTNPVFGETPIGMEPPTATSAKGWKMLRDKKGGDLEEFPEDLRIREFPKHVVEPSACR